MSYRKVWYQVDIRFHNKIDELLGYPPSTTWHHYEFDTFEELLQVVGIQTQNGSEMQNIGRVLAVPADLTPEELARVNAARENSDAKSNKKRIT